MWTRKQYKRKKGRGRKEGNKEEEEARMIKGWRGGRGRGRATHTKARQTWWAAWP